MALIKHSLEKPNTKLSHVVDQLRHELHQLKDQATGKLAEIKEDLEALIQSPLLTGAFLHSLRQENPKLLRRVLQVAFACGLAFTASMAADKDTDSPFGVNKTLAKGNQNNPAMVTDQMLTEMASERIGPSERHRSIYEEPPRDHYLPEEGNIETAADTRISGVVNLQGLNLRGGPGTSFTVQQNLNQGEIVYVLAEVEDPTNPNWSWLEVKTEDEIRGFVSPAYVETDLTTVPRETFEGEISTPQTPETRVPTPEATQTPAPQDNQAPEPTPTPQPTEQAPQYDYSVIPEGYDCVGTRAAVRFCHDHGVKCVFTTPDMGSLHFNLANRWLVAQTFEDDPQTMNYPGCYPEGCIFWNTPMLLGHNYSEASVTHVGLHELVHIEQARRDQELAIHLDALNPNQAPLNLGYQCLIEGHAEKTGYQVGVSHLYYRFRTIYKVWGEWALDNQKYDLYLRAANGDWAAYNQFVQDYQNITEESLETFLNRYP
jgi:hypothetical protein